MPTVAPPALSVAILAQPGTTISAFPESYRATPHADSSLPMPTRCSVSRVSNSSQRTVMRSASCWACSFVVSNFSTSPLAYHTFTKFVPCSRTRTVTSHSGFVAIALPAPAVADRHSNINYGSKQRVSCFATQPDLIGGKLKPKWDLARPRGCAPPERRDKNSRAQRASPLHGTKFTKMRVTLARFNDMPLQVSARAIYTGQPQRSFRTAVKGVRLEHRAPAGAHTCSCTGTLVAIIRRQASSFAYSWGPAGLLQRVGGPTAAPQAMAIYHSGIDFNWFAPSFTSLADRSCFTAGRAEELAASSELMHCAAKSAEPDGQLRRRAAAHRLTCTAA